MATTITDVTIIALLIGVLVFAQIVNRRVQRLMSVLRELEPVVQEYSDAVERSRQSVHQMQRSLSEEVAAHPLETGANPSFSSRRVTDVRDMGMRVIRGKQDLVRRFFDETRGERKV